MNSSNRALYIFILLLTLGVQTYADDAAQRPVYAFCGMGDNLSMPTAEPTDNPATS